MGNGDPSRGVSSQDKVTLWEKTFSPVPSGSGIEASMTCSCCYSRD
jgi:hypothetical protein